MECRRVERDGDHEGADDDGSGEVDDVDEAVGECAADEAGERNGAAPA